MKEISFRTKKRKEKIFFNFIVSNNIDPGKYLRAYDL